MNDAEIACIFFIRLVGKRDQMSQVPKKSNTSSAGEIVRALLGDALGLETVLQHSDVGPEIGKHLDCDLVMEWNIGGDEANYEWIMPHKPSYYDLQEWKRMSCRRVMFELVMENMLSNALLHIANDANETEKVLDKPFAFGFVQEDGEIFSPYLFSDNTTINGYRNGRPTLRFTDSYVSVTEGSPPPESIIYELKTLGQFWYKIHSLDPRHIELDASLFKGINLEHHGFIASTKVAEIFREHLPKLNSGNLILRLIDPVYGQYVYYETSSLGKVVSKGKIGEHYFINISFNTYFPVASIVMEQDNVYIKEDGRFYQLNKFRHTGDVPVTTPYIRGYDISVLPYLQKNASLALLHTAPQGAEQEPEGQEKQVAIFHKRNSMLIGNAWNMSHALHEMSTILKKKQKSWENRNNLEEDSVVRARLEVRDTDSTMLAVIECKRSAEAWARTDWIYRKFIYINPTLCAEKEYNIDVNLISVVFVTTR